MKQFFSIYVIYYLSAISWGQRAVDEQNCANATRIIVAVNLLDKDCMRTTSVDFINENDVETRDVEMDTYAVCLLKKSSIMDKDGNVNLYFDIVKIVDNLYKKTDDRGFGLAFIIKAIHNCRNLSGKDTFATATKIMKCLLDNQETIIWCNKR